jgi:hypothetical protein
VPCFSASAAVHGGAELRDFDFFSFFFGIICGELRRTFTRKENKTGGLFAK